MSGIDYNAYGWTREFSDHYLLGQEWPEWQLREVRAAWPRPSSPAAGSRNAPNAPTSQQSLRASSEDSYIPQSITTSDLLPQPSTPSMASQQGTNTLIVRPEWHTSSPPSLEPHTPGTPVSLSSLAGPPMELVTDEAPYGLPDKFPEGSKYWRAGTFNPAYSPNEKNVAALWQGAITDEKRQEWVKLWDHVDFYRLVYITVVLRGDVTRHHDSLEDQYLLQNIAEIFNRASPDTANRPPGFNKVLRDRRKLISVDDLKALFILLNNKTNPDRAKPLTFLLHWAKDREFGSFTPKMILNGIPEAIWAHFKVTYIQSCDNPKKFRWERGFLPYFQYENLDGVWNLPRSTAAPSQPTTSYQSEVQSGPSGVQPYDQQQVAPQLQEGRRISSTKGKGKHSAPSSSSESHQSHSAHRVGKRAQR